MSSLRALAVRGRLGPSTQAIIDVADRRHIPWTRLNERNLVQLGWGVHTRRIRATVTSETSLIGAEMARDKDEAAAALERSGLPTPGWRLAASVAEALAHGRALGYPVVIKPVDGHHGRGVTLDITDDDGAAARVRAGGRVEPAPAGHRPAPGPRSRPSSARHRRAARRLCRARARGRRGRRSIDHRRARRSRERGPATRRRPRPGAHQDPRSTRRHRRCSPRRG